MMHSHVYKIISNKDWEESQKLGYVKLLALDTQFIHMCSEDQISAIISKFWKTHSDIMILKLDSAKLEGRLVKEKNPGGSTEYYHLYEGKIPLQAVIEARNYAE